MTKAKKTVRNTSPRRKAMKLPKMIRDELRMVVALRGFSNMKSGEGRNIKMQENQMHSYYHGSEPTRPSQIGMICKGEGAYQDFYDSLSKPVVDKRTEVMSKLHLSKELTQDDTSFLSQVWISM